MTRQTDRAKKGFIISLELILIITILMIGTFAGCALIRDALFKFKFRNQLIVVDNEFKRIGRKIFDFDEFEAPRVIINDPEFEWLRVLLGVRFDRFTTRQQIFYTDNGCGLDPAATACIITAGDRSIEEGTFTPSLSSAPPSFLDEPFGPAGNIGFHSELYPMQLLSNGTPLSYGIGADLDVDNSSPLSPLRLPGTLYRSGGFDNGCNEVCSVWTSQKEVQGEPCDEIPGCLEICSQIDTCATTAPAMECDGGMSTDCEVGEPCFADVNPLFKCGGNFNNAQKNCPGGNNPILVDDTCDGIIDEEINCALLPPDPMQQQCVCPVAEGWFNLFGSNCCPLGSTEVAGQCSQVNLNVVGRSAEPVQFPNSSTNLLSIFDLFFQVPPPHAFEFFSIPPTSEGQGLPGPAELANGVPLLDDRFIGVGEPPTPESDGLP